MLLECTTMGKHVCPFGRLYSPEPTPGNSYHSKAIAVKKGAKIIGHISRDQAEQLHVILAQYSKKSFLKVKEAGTTVVSQQQSPRQKCRLGIMLDNAIF